MYGGRNDILKTLETATFAVEAQSSKYWLASTRALTICCCCCHCCFKLQGENAILNPPRAKFLNHWHSVIFETFAFFTVSMNFQLCSCCLHFFYLPPIFNCNSKILRCWYSNYIIQVVFNCKIGYILSCLHLSCYAQQLCKIRFSWGSWYVTKFGI